MSGSTMKDCVHAEICEGLHDTLSRERLWLLCDLKRICICPAQRRLSFRERGALAVNSQVEQCWGSRFETLRTFARDNRRKAALLT